MELTPSGITKILQGELSRNSSFKPIVQVLAHKLIPTTGDASTERCKYVLSDGEHYVSTITVKSDLYAMAKNGDIVKNSIVRIDSARVHSPDNVKKVIIVENLAVVAKHAEKIGSPKQMTATEASSVSSSAAATNQANKQITDSLRTASIGDVGNIYPIASLNPYQNKWTIKARVTKKSDIKTWSNARGEGKLFSMDLMDSSGEIRCTGFTDVVDKYFNIIEQGKVYYISRCVLKTANKQYTALKNDYEMTMTNDTTVVLCTDNDSVPKVQLNYTSISDLENCANNSFVDVLGVVTDCGDVMNLTSRAGKELVKRELKIADKSGAEVRLTLWGNDAQNFDNSYTNPVVAIKAAKVSDFGGRSLSVSFNSTLNVNPDDPKAQELLGWYNTEGKNAAIRSLTGSQGGGGSMDTPFKTFAEVNAADMSSAPAQYFSTKATIVFVKKDNCMYKACPSSDCNKKVIAESESEFRCEKCNKTYPNFQYRLMCTVKVADYTGQEWVTCFNDCGEKLLGVSAAELGSYKDNDDNKFDELMSNVNFRSFVFKLRSRVESYNDENRLKCSAMALDEVDYVADIRRSLKEIRALEVM